MKKLLNVLLVLTICLGLVACGNDSSNDDTSADSTIQNDSSQDNNTEEITVELTADNWKDYFEINLVATELYDDDKFDELIIFFRIDFKSDILDKVVSVKVKEFDYQLVNPYACTFTYNFDTKELISSEFDTNVAQGYDVEDVLKEWVGEDDTNTRSLTLDDFVNSKGFRYITMDKVPPWTAESNGIVEENIFKTFGVNYESIIITRMEGQITIEEKFKF